MRARLPLAALLVLTSAPLSAQQPQLSRSDQLEMVAEARAEGDFARARQILLSLIAASPDDADLLRRLAMIEAGAERLDEAKKRIDQATRLAPQDLDVALARGFILNWRGDVSEAQRVAATISARDPDYPELDQLNAAIARQQATDSFHLRAITVGTGVSDITTANGLNRTWNSQNLVTAFDVSNKDTVALGVMREQRSATDTRISARVDHRIADGSVYLAATAVPSPDFLERWSVGTGGEIKAAEAVTALVDLRVADYETGTIAALQPGLRVALGQDFSLTGRAINIFGGDEGFRLGGSMRLDYGRESKMPIFLIAASYPDAEADGLRQLRSLAAGLGLPLTDSFGLTVAGSYENRENSYRRYAGTLSLTYRFPTP